MKKNDYLRNRFAAEDLASRITDWWHQRGFIGVRVWVEEEQVTSPFGAKLPTNYSIRSNISMSVADLENGVVV